MVLVQRWKDLVLWEFTLSPMQSDIGMLSMEGDHARKPLLQEKYTEKSPQISPDGRWMAYTSNESGKNEVYVRPFPEVNKGKWQVSTAAETARYGRRMAGSCFTIAVMRSWRFRWKQSQLQTWKANSSFSRNILLARWHRLDNLPIGTSARTASGS